MRPHLNLPPVQLAGLGLIGTLMAETIFLVPRHALIQHGLFYGLLLYMTPCLLGLGLSLWATTELRNGVHNGIWTDDQLSPLRRITLSPFFAAVAFALLAAFLLLTVFNLASHAHPTRGWGWAAYLVLMFLQQLQLATKRPTVNVSTAPRIDWRTRAPLQSDHWGER